MSDAFEEFGPYLVYERLGQGGMATVHRAEKRGAGIRRPIALKRLLPHVAADPALVTLFVDEARLASHLHHANVAQTYELGKVGDTFFIAMEYASGPTLAQIVRQCHKAAGEIPATITVNILSQVCEALDYAHHLCDESGQPLRIVHRDVSPANLIVTSAGIVKLIDFGIAKATISSVKTQTGFIKGKFGYIAPEYITGKIDARADLFAVGVVAHEMLAGRRLFEGQDDFETLSNIREMPVSPPSRWNPHVPADLDDIVMTALERDPTRRWQSAGAMQVALANVARQLGLVVGTQQLAEWVEWAFSQVPAGATPPAGGSRRPDSSLSIHISRGSIDDAAVTPRPELTPHRGTQPHPARLPSDSEKTVQRERVAPRARDLELFTPSPELAPPPPGRPPPRAPRAEDVVAALPVAPPPPQPRPSRALEAVATPTVPLRSARPALPFEAPRPTPPGISRTPDPRDAAVPLPAPPRVPPSALAPVPPPIPLPVPPRSSRAMPAATPPSPPDPDAAPPGELAPATPPPGDRRDPPGSADPDPPAERSTLQRKARSRAARSIQKTRPTPEPARVDAMPSDDDEAGAAPRSRRNLVWLILLMVALGTGAMAAATYWPADL